MEVIKPQHGIGAKAISDRRRDAPAFARDILASGLVGIMDHGVQPHGDAMLAGEDLIQIGRGPEEIVAADAALDLGETAKLGFPLHQIDAAADIAATGNRRAGTLGNLDILDIEGIAEEQADIPQAVDEHIIACGETADGDGVRAARRVALARIQRDAGDIAQAVAQAAAALFHQQGVVDHGHSARQVQQRQLDRIVRNLLHAVRTADDVDFLYGPARLFVALNGGVRCILGRRGGA